MRGDCQTWRHEIEEGTSGAPLPAGALAHLSGCAGCRAAREEGERLRSLLGGLGRVDAPADFEFRLRARMAREEVRAGGEPARTRFAFGLAAAACFAVVCAVAFLRGPAPGTADPAGRHSAGEAAPLAADARPQPTTDGPAAPAVQAAQAAEAAAAARTAEADRTAATAAGQEFAAVTQPPRRAAAAVRVSGREPARAGGVSRERGLAASGSRGAGGQANQALREEVASVQGRPLAIPVGGSDEPLRVLLRDEHGAARSVPTRSVSFGAQQIVAREGAAQKVSSEKQEGVW